MKNIKLKVKIYTALVNKKEKEIKGLEQHIKLIKEWLARGTSIFGTKIN